MNRSISRFLDDLDRRDEEGREDLSGRKNAMPDLSKIRLDALDPGEKFIVKWQYGLAESFQQLLIQTIQMADDNNLKRLAMGFPLEVEAYGHYARTFGWWDDVKRRANID